jgi:hypothetical protein
LNLPSYRGDIINGNEAWRQRYAALTRQATPGGDFDSGDSIGAARRFGKFGATRYAYCAPRADLSDSFRRFVYKCLSGVEICRDC